jgi:hypothetical protein
MLWSYLVRGCNVSILGSVTLNASIILVASEVPVLSGTVATFEKLNESFEKPCCQNCL